MKSFSKLVERAMAEGPVKVMKDEDGIDNPYALSAWMKNQGRKSQPVRVAHPTFGDGTVISITETEARISWDRLASWTSHSGVVDLKEARKVILMDDDKYFNEQDFPEDTLMAKSDKMTAEEHFSLMEDFVDVPAPRDSILSSPSPHKSDSAGPLSGLDGDGGGNPTPHEEGKSLPDEPATPKVDSMDEPSRKVTMSQKVGRPMGSKSSTSSDSDTGSDSGSSSDSGKGKFVKAKKGENPFAKKDDSSETDSSDDKKDEDMAKDDKKKDEVEETLTFSEADIEGIVEVEDDDDDDKDDVEEDCGEDHDDDDDDDDKGGKFEKGKKGVNPFPDKDDVKEMHGDQEYAMEHEMGGGEIAVTTEFMVKLLSGVAAANLDDEKFQMIADCIADCCGEDRTLDVGDIGEVMSKLQDKVSGGGDDMGDYGDEAEEDVAVGDGEVAGPEGGDEYEGETKLMAGRGRPMREAKKGSRRGKRKLDEMWIAGIPGMTAGTQPKRKMVNTDGMTEDEIFDAEIKLMQQRAGIIE